MKKYDFDDVMYTKGNFCVTCQIEKPARSKHCRVCNVCVEKFDHHCIWINQCAGANNYRWFLLFLFFHLIICIYGFVAGMLIFLGDMTMKRLAGINFKHNVTGEIIEPTASLLAKFFFLNEERHLGVVIIICGFMIIALGIFLFYHLYILAWNNQTTNEAFKLGSCKRRLIRQE